MGHLKLLGLGSKFSLLTMQKNKRQTDKLMLAEAYRSFYKHCFGFVWGFFLVCLFVLVIV